jgi:fos-like antigen
MNSQYSGYTLTTPTLTPTTLQTINDAIYESETKYGSFVPPLPSSIVLQNTWQGGSIIAEEEEYHVPVQVAKKPRGGKRASGGRRPNNRQVSPEEDERRKIRRERNKLAAARCRKRRVDHTNTLVEETEQLESTKREIQKQINQLQSERDELEFILQAHNSNCSKIAKGKFTPSGGKKQRPNSLPVQPASAQVVTSSGSVAMTSSATPGIPLSTPSNGFDLDWGDLPSTGLTPSASLANQTLMTPLVTPSTANAILSSLNVKQEFVEL